MMEIGSSGNRSIGKPNLTTETPTPPRETRACWGARARRHGEKQEIEIMISTSDLTSFNSPLCAFVSSVVNGFSVLTVFVLKVFGNFGIAGNSLRIGVSS